MLGSMMEDTEEETGREGEWREERSIVGGYDGGHRGGDREAVGGWEWEWREERSIVGGMMEDTEGGTGRQ